MCTTNRILTAVVVYEDEKRSNGVLLLCPAADNSALLERPKKEPPRDSPVSLRLPVCARGVLLLP